MKVSFVDIGKHIGDILHALERNEPVTIMYYGKQKGIIAPARPGKSDIRPVQEHPAFGMWKDRDDIEDAVRFVRDIRQGRSFPA